jgi:hypothetical protein
VSRREDGTKDENSRKYQGYEFVTLQLKVDYYLVNNFDLFSLSFAE